MHKKCGTVGIVSLNEDLQLTSLCQGNGDMLVAASNSEKAIFTVTINFDGVGILGTATMVIKYLDEWQDVTSLALSGEKLAICVDGKIYVHVLSQGITTPITTSSNMSPVSSKATSVCWLGSGLVYCEDHCIKLYDNDIVSVIAGGNGKGDVDGPAAHSKLCQPIGVCVEFNRNIYVADSGSGSVKMINRPLQGIVDFLSNLQALLVAFNIHSKGKSEMGHHHTAGEAIQMVNQTLYYVQTCSTKAKELQSLSEKSVTNGPEGTVSSKCLKSLELLKKSLQSMQANIKELSTYPGFNLQLNLEALLTLHVENQHAVTHFKRDTFSLYEYALIFGSSIEEAVKRVSKWAAAYYTHPGSYYKLPTTGAVSLPKINIPKPAASQVTRNEEAQMRAWAKRHGKSVRQKNVRQDNTKDRAGTLPLNLYETETILNPLNLQLLTNDEPSIDDGNNEVSQFEQIPEQVEPVDTFSDSETDSSDDDNESAEHQTLHTAINLIQPTRLGRVRQLTSRMTDFLQNM